MGMLSLTKDFAANTISTLSMGIVVPRAKVKNSFGTINNKTDPKYGIDKYAVLEYSQDTNGRIEATQLDHFFAYDNIALIDFSKLSKTNLLNLLETLVEVGLPKNIKAIQLNNEHQSDDIKIALAELINKHRYINELELRYSSNLPNAVLDKVEILGSISSAHSPSPATGMPAFVVVAPSTTSESVTTATLTPPPTPMTIVGEATAEVSTPLATPMFGGTPADGIPVDLLNLLVKAILTATPNNPSTPLYTAQVTTAPVTATATAVPSASPIRTEKCTTGFNLLRAFGKIFETHSITELNTIAELSLEKLLRSVEGVKVQELIDSGFTPFRVNKSGDQRQQFCNESFIGVSDSGILVYKDPQFGDIGFQEGSSLVIEVAVDKIKA